MPSRYKEFFTHRRALSIVVIRSQNRFVLLLLFCVIEPASKLFFWESSQADTRDQHAIGDYSSRVLSPHEMKSFFVGSAPVKYLTSSSRTLHIFVFFLRCSQPENTNVYLTCVAGGCLCFVKEEIQRRESWTKVETKRWGRGRGEKAKNSCLLPSPPPRHFLFRSRFSFRAVLSLTLRNTTVKARQKTASYAG